MHKTLIVIPTRGRNEKLRKCVKSMECEKWESVHAGIIFDNDEKSWDSIELDDLDINLLYSLRMILSEWSKETECPAGSVHCRNSVIMENRFKNHNVLAAVDDVVFKPGAIDSAIDELYENFPDSDGVIGFRQDGNTYHPTGMFIAGSKFVDRYPERQLFCPQYFHFAAQEIHWHAEKLGKFKQGSEAVCVEHFHQQRPDVEVDQTHIDARKYKKRDHDLIKARKEAGLIWGYNG